MAKQTAIDLLANIPAELGNPSLWLQCDASKHPIVKYKTPKLREANLRSLDNLRKRPPREGYGLQRYVDKAERFFYIDLDHCVDGIGIEPWAQSIVDDFPTYAEYSPSGEGLHIVGLGTLPEDFHCHPHKVEIYCGNIPNKLIVFTGNVLEGHTKIVDCQVKLEALLQKVKAEVGMDTSKIQVQVVDEHDIQEDNEPSPVFSRLPGALGELVEAVGPSLPYDHKALVAITCIGVQISARVRLASDPWLQPRFYSCMIGPPGGGKSAPDVEMRRALFDTVPHLLAGIHVETSIDSGPALVQALEDPVHRRMILAPDEMAVQFEKARATPGSKSSLFGEFLKLYEGNTTANRTKQTYRGGGLVEITDAHFGIIGSATTDEFPLIWQGVRGAASGLQSRFTLSFSEQILPVIQKPNDETVMAAALFDLEKTIGKEALSTVRGITLTEEAQNELVDWGGWVQEDARPWERRLIDMAKRFAMVLAACSGVNKIALQPMRLGIGFAEYESFLRSALFPEDSSSNVQAFENRVLNFYQKHLSASEKVAMNHIRPERWPGGFEAFNRAFAALIRAGKLVCVGKSRKGEPIYRLE